MPLDAIIGHAPAVALLRGAVRRGRVPQSLLFAGPAGVGKRAVAIALAQAVNCPVRRKHAGDDACGTCLVCQRVARGQHTDVALIDRGEEASIKIKLLRERVLDVIGYRPFEGERRVFIIDSADELTPEAQDALLKTLEEPPPSAILILITAYPDTLSATIQSRCRRVRFGPLAEADVVRVLSDRLRTAPTEARALAAVSGGSIGRALAAQGRDLKADRAAALAVVAAGRGRVGDRLTAAARLAKHDSERRDREALGDRLAIVASLLRDLGILAAQSSSTLANGDFEDHLRGLSSIYDLARVTGGYETISRAQEALEHNASPKIVADWIAVKL
jgi:DNA polymerase III subunit delta'